MTSTAWLAGLLLLLAGPYVLHAADEQALLDRAVERHFGEHARAGVLVAVLLTPAGEFTTVAGTRARHDDYRTERATAFEAGSVTKLFTGMLLAALEDDGVIASDARIGELVPAEHPLAPAVGKIQLRELANHTSGLPRLATGGPRPLAALARPGDPYRGSTAEEIYAALTLLGDEDVSGRGQFLYSNLGMALLGRLLEQATDRPYETLVTERLLAPLGMHNASFECTDDPAIPRAQGHRANFRPTGNWCLDGYAPAGGLVATADDLARFVQRALAGGLSALDRSLEPTHRRTPADAVGYAWMLRDRDGSALAWHNGRTGGYYAFVGIDRDGQRGVVVLASVSFRGDVLGFDLLQGTETPPATPTSGVWQALVSLLLLLGPVLALGRWREFRRTLADATAPPRCRLHMVTTLAEIALVLAIAYWVVPWQVLPFALWWLSLGLSALLLSAALPDAGRLGWGLPGRPIRTVGLMLWSVLALALLLWVLHW